MNNDKLKFKINIMKKQITLLAAIMLFIATSINATVWRVNNRVNVDADFTTLGAAISGSSANDTLYLEGSPTSYGNAYIYSPVTIIGTGYFLNENDSTQAYKEKSIVGSLYFNNGSQGSVVEGLYIDAVNTYVPAYGVYINTNDITIRRNYIFGHGNYNWVHHYGIYVVATYNSLTIEQNWIRPYAPNSDGSYTHAIHFVAYTIGSLIQNNIIYCDTNGRAIYMGEDNEASSLIVKNNAIMGNITTYNSSHYNNILIHGSYTPATNDLNSNNICDLTQYPNENDNQQSVVMSTVFEDYTTNIDNGYILKAGSPAIGSGVLAVDCGPFGTNDPYVLSGMPPIPAIFDLEMNQTIGTSTIPVTVKSMSHK